MLSTCIISLRACNKITGENQSYDNTHLLIPELTCSTHSCTSKGKADYAHPIEKKARKPTWLNVDLSFLPFLLALAFASAAAAAATAEEDFLVAVFLGLGGTFLKPPCNVQK